MPRRDGAKRRWVLAYLHGNRRWLALVLALAAATFVCASMLMFWAGYLIGRTAEPLMTLALIMTPVALVQLFGFGRPVLHYIERLVSHDWVLRIASELRMRLFAAADRAAGDPGSRRTVGEYLGLLSDDIGHLQNLFLRIVMPLLAAWLVSVLAVAALGFCSVWFACVALLVLAVVCVLLPLASLLVTRARAARAKAQASDAYRRTADDVLGAADWLYAGRSAERVEASARAFGRMQHANASVRTSRRAVEFASMVVLGLAAVLVIWWAQGRFGGSVEAPGNWVIAFALGFFPLVDAFAPLPGAAAESTAHREAVDRLQDLAGFADKEADDISSGSCEPLPPGPLEVRVEHASFAYPGRDDAALDGLDLVIPAGQRVCILGRSGAGKSTFLSLVHGDFAPQGGSVLLGGVPAAAASDVPTRVGVVGQRPHLFNRTLRENLALGREGIDDARMVEALHEVGLGGLLERIGGLDALVAEDGSQFSGGERTRVAFARVLLSDAGLVLLDEPFASLDPVTERQLVDTVLRVFDEATLVLVTHHLSQVSRFDRVVFIDEGRVDLDGAPEELARSSERFARLLELERVPGSSACGAS